MVIQKITPAQIELYLQLKLNLFRETKFMAYEAEEISETGVDKYQTKLLNLLGSPVTLALGAFDGDNLIGSLELMGNSHKKWRHKAKLLMGVRASHQGRGIGRSLLEKALSLSSHHKIELTVVANNGSAFTLYESVGFLTEGLIRDSILIDGKLFDEIQMGLVLSDENYKN